MEFNGQFLDRHNEKSVISVICKPPYVFGTTLFERQFFLFWSLFIPSVFEKIIIEKSKPYLIYIQFPLKIKNAAVCYIAFY